MFADLRYALRTLLRSPGLTIAAVVTLGLGIGANATMFGIVDRLCFQAPPQVLDPGRVVRVYVTQGTPPFGPFTGVVANYPKYADLRDHANGFASLAAFSSASMSLGRGSDAQQVTAGVTTASLFSMLGVRPALGRFFSGDEDLEGRGAHVAVLGEEFWRRHFGADSSVLGKTLPLARGLYTVVGVAPAGFTGVDWQAVDVWVPISTAAPELGHDLACKGCYWLTTVGRLRPGVTAAQVASQATGVYRHGGGSEPRDSTATVTLGPIQAARGPNLSTNAKLSLWLCAVAAIVLLIACANVANLLLARSVQRRREVAIRLALGAGRGRLIRQLYTESAVLAACGGAAAVLVAVWVGPRLRAALLHDATIARVLDLRVFAFTAGAALVTALLAGLGPALHAGVPDLSSALKSGPREGGVQRSVTMSGLLVAQVALTMVLLTGAGLFLTSLRHVQGLRLGFDADHLIVAGGDFGALGYKTTDVNGLYERMRERVARLPGVAGTSLSIGSPFGSVSMFRVAVPGVDSLPNTPTGGLFVAGVTPDYFQTMGSAVRRGRVFTDADNAGGQRVVVVNETMARLVWPGQDPIGKCMNIGGP